MSRLIDDIVTLTKEGWRPYRGIVQAEVYQNLECEWGSLALKGKNLRTRPYWFTRGDIYLCLGCTRRCSLNRPAGFQVPLDIHYTYDPEQPFTLTPQEMIGRKHTLLVREAAYCLNCSESLVYRYITEGRLAALKDKPARIRVSDVAAMMNDFDD
jgi:hypothetical protein